MYWRCGGRCPTTAPGFDLTHSGRSQWAFPVPPFNLDMQAPGIQAPGIHGTQANLISRQSVLLDPGVPPFGGSYNVCCASIRLLKRYRSLTDPLKRPLLSRLETMNRGKSPTGPQDEGKDFR